MSFTASFLTFYSTTYKYFAKRGWAYTREDNFDISVMLLNYLQMNKSCFRG